MNSYLNVGCNNDDDTELRELQLCEVALPPEVGPHARTQTGQQVVAVHHAVNETVQRARDPRRTTCGGSHASIRNKNEAFDKFFAWMRALLLFLEKHFVADLLHNGIPNNKK